jgi:hypothetical protein
MASALDGGEWSASRPGRALAPGKGPPVPIVQEAGWAPEPVWTERLQAVPLPGIEPRSPGRPVRSQTLYRLSYLGSLFKNSVHTANKTLHNYNDQLFHAVQGNIPCLHR